MTEADNYNVICTGDLIEGFELVDVQASFSELFKLSPEKAAEFLGSKRTLKKDLPHSKAQAYKDKLESIGVVTVLEKIAADTGTFGGLALEPMEEPEPQAHKVSGASTLGTGLALEPIEQPPVADSKDVSPTSEAAPEKYIAGERRKPAAEEAQAEAIEEPDKLNLTALGAAAVAALIGAFVWKFIAVAFEYEHSLVALGIGAAVGYAALAMGSRGQLCGIVCGVLALVSILGGKYMAVDSFLNQELDFLSEGFASEEYQAIMDEQANIAAYYVENVHTDDELRVFMVDYGYSEEYSPELITQQEVDDFRSHVAPMLEGVAQGDFDVAGWMRDTYAKELENVSTWDIVKESLGFIDFLFLFFGVGAAYKLASGGIQKDE